MKRTYRTAMEVSCLLGVVSLVLGFAARFIPRLPFQLQSTFEPRSALLFAGSMFLCAVASDAMRRLDVP